MQMQTLKMTGVIALAILIGSLLLVLFMHTTGSITMWEKTVLTILPGEETLGVFSNIEGEQWEDLQTLFPFLSQAVPGPGKTVALLKKGDSSGIVELQDTRVRDDVGQVAWNYFAISSSDDETMQLIGENKHSISTLPGIPSILPSIRSADQWILIRLDALQNEPTFFSFIRDLAPKGTTHIFVAEEDERTTFSFLGGTESSKRTTIQSIPIIGTGTVLRIAVSNAEELLQTLSDSENTTTSIFGGILTQKTREIFGPEISLTYGLGPLLQQPSLITLKKNSSGALLLAIEGSVNSSRKLHTTLLELHQTIAATFSESSVNERFLGDDRFVKDIRVNEEAVTSEISSIGQWLVQKTGNENRVLITAENSERFFMTTSEDLLSEMLTDRMRTPLPGSSSFFQRTIFAGGFLELDLMRDLFEPMLLGSEILLKNLQTGPIFWSVRQNPGSLTVEIVPGVH